MPNWFWLDCAYVLGALVVGMVLVAYVEYQVYKNRDGEE